MATNVRGRSGPRSTSGSFGFGGWGNSSGRMTTGRKTKKVTSVTAASPKYRQVCNEFACKISSYKMLYNQTRGPARYTRPTPQMLNTFANWVNKGAIIQTCTPAQLAKWARTNNMHFNNRQPTTASCKNILSRKFGKNVIKAVARTKSGSFMVATSPTWKGKTFHFPK